MGLFGSLGDTLKDVFNQVDPKAVPGLISSILAKTDVGDLQGIASKLQAAGFGDQVKSWLGNGANLPISADQLRSALGNEQVQQMAEQAQNKRPSVVDQVSSFYAQHPDVVKAAGGMALSIMLQHMLSRRA